MFFYLKETTIFENDHDQSKAYLLLMLHLHAHAALSTFMDNIMTIPSINFVISI